MKQVIIAVVVAALVGAGAWYAFGSGEGSKSGTFGSETATVVTPINAIQRDPEKYLGQVVTVEGEMTKECPGSGCWWYVKDQTGEMRADSLGGGFALPLNQEGRHVRTTGKVVKMESDELQIAATGAELR